MRLIALFTLIASPAFATCPTSADLRTGVVLVQNDPVFIRADFDLTGQGLREVRLTRGADESEAVELRLSEHVLAPGLINRSSGRSLLTYDGDVTTLDRIEALGEARFAVTETGEDAAQDRARDVLFTHRDTGETEILTCTYTTWTVREMQAAGETITTFEHTYAPALGLVLASRRLDASGGAEVLFDYNWIGTAADVAR